ncbi:hypothetical protein [Xanthobacter oligotrophicus]|uniref:hypothetical protein n=1 Tax=Xanthobacter oligotrophicus TaxID=2607286 RepID=UPI0011F1FDFF|nr:hypothetical protein [Xanthobacter oligotrophicus]MCG5234925.1 winged helix-turn-helix domain-containing protein [Xanthobacter oligotrophicus]
MAQAGETLSDFLIRRRREIAEAQDRLHAELHALNVESDQIELAAKVAGVEDHVVTKETYVERTIFGGLIRGSREKVVAERTIKEAVVRTLTDAGRGMTAQEILPVVNKHLGVDYPRTSLSPQLSRLKHDGIVERNGIVWSLVSAPQKEEPPSAPAEGGSKPEDGGASNPALFE